jgi:beta-galactosidase
MSDFSIYGGLYRYVDLEYVPAVSIDKVFADASTDKIKVRALLYRPTVEQPKGFTVKLTDPTGKVLLQEERQGTGRDTIALGEIAVKAPQLWSPDHPALYTLEVGVKNGGSKTEMVGFRSYSFVDHGPFIFNGQRLLLKGTTRHEDAAGTGAAMTEEAMRKEMILIKNMGANYLRLAHYQQSPIILRLCDSLGILVWEEIPWCRGGLGGPAYQDQARRMLTNMISQHYNHPAVIIWGLGNENDWPGDFPEFDKKKIHDFMKELNDLAHRLDPSRKTGIRRCAFCSDVPDVYSPSIWAGWYRGVYTEYRTASEEEAKKVPHMVHMEWGGDSHARRHSENPDKVLLQVHGGQGTDERTGDASLYGGAARVSKDGDWSESYICNLFDWHLKEQETMPWLTGAAQWIFKDFSTPSRPDNPVPFVNQKGLVERDGTLKESYYVFQSYWTSKLMAHIYGHTWPVRWGDAGEEKMVKVYSNAAEAELFVNGRSVGVKHRNSPDFPAAGLRWAVVFQPGENTLRVVAKKGKEAVEDSVRLIYETRHWGTPAKLELSKDGDWVKVRLVDANGVPCLDAASWVRWGMTGDGRLVDDLGTSTGSRYVQAFNGVSMIRVAPLNGGHAVVSVSVQGLPTEFIQL